MKKDEKGNNSEFTNKMKEMGWREIRREARPAITLKPENKSRITIYLDSDIVEYYKAQAKKQSGTRYQTLINRSLRTTIDFEGVLPNTIKESLLNDEQFLQSLKSALAL